MAPIEAGSAGSYRLEVLGAEIEVNSPLTGAHQHRNLALAVAAAVQLATEHYFPITPAAIADGIRQTRWPARLEHIQKDGAEWILDVAHNPAGAWALRAGLNSMGDPKPRTLIFSCLRDKPVTEMAQILFPIFDRVILAPIHSARAAAVQDLLAAAEATGTEASSADSVAEAMRIAVANNNAGMEAGPIVISGSVYLVGEARTLLLEEGVSQP
jgi:dihydrofolate synthase/folylpolyglutamate synthase